MLTQDEGQEITFYKELQNCSGIDFRDERGKVHDMPFILFGVIIGLLRHRDGVLSSIHRSMVNTHDRICEALGIKLQRVVSHSQLPRILE